MKKSQERRGRDFWAAAVADFERSGLTQREFCNERGFKFLTFRHWLYRLRRERQSPNARFIPLVPSTPRSSAPLRMRLGKLEVDFSEQPDAGYLAELLLRLMDR